MRHATDPTQFAAVYVTNVRTHKNITEEIEEKGTGERETMRVVTCRRCFSHVAWKDAKGTYYFFNALASQA